MKASATGINFITGFEGFRADAYRDSGGVLTIGYGHTGRDVREGLTITHERALALLAKDVVWAEDAVNKAMAKLAGSRKFSQNAFDALVSFVFNCGAGTLETDRSVGAAIRKGNRYVPAAMALFVKDAAGHVLAGLVRRRRAEGELFATRSSPTEWLTAVELRRVRRLDALHKLDKPTAKERTEIATLVAQLTEQRKRIWHGAQPKTHGGDGRGWEYRDRRRRYNSLLSRTL